MEAIYELEEQPVWDPLAARKSHSFSLIGSASKDNPAQELHSCPHPGVRFYGTEFENIHPHPVLARREQSGGAFVFRPLSEIFAELAVQWKEDTWFLSSSTQISRHPAYRKIIDMGYAAIPLILQDLQRTPDQWFVALNSITGENPVREDDAGIVDSMRDAWLQWGRDRNFI